MFGLKWYFEALIVLAIAAGGLYGWHKVADGYREQGRTEITIKWEQQKLADAEAHVKDIKSAIKQERDNAAEIAKIDKHLIEVISNEKIALDNQLANLRTDNRRLRTITGKAIREPKSGMPSDKLAVSADNATCTVRLPREIGEGFERLRETTLRIGSEANNTASTLTAAQAVMQKRD